MSQVEIRIPDLGDSKDVAVIEVMIQDGSILKVEDPLVTLETDKATMDVPSPVAGVVASVRLKKGDRVESGTLVAVVEAVAAPGTAPASLRGVFSVRGARGALFG